MERSELEKMKVDALRSMAAERGLAGAEGMDKSELVDLLARDEKAGMFGRARQAVARAAHKVEEKAHELADRLRHQTPAPNLTEVKGAQPPAREPATKEAKKGRPQRASFDIPSSTVHPHADELETLTMARLYLQEQRYDRAIEIYEKLAQLDPDDEEIRAVLVDLRTKTAAPPPAPPPPQHPGEPMWMLDLEELPETYGLDECEVLYKDPFWVFAYWEVTDNGLNSARAQLGPSAASARLVLRLFTTIQGAGGVDRQTHDIDLTWNHGRRYFQAPRPGAHLRVAVGLLSPEGYFAPIAHSSLVRVPYAEPGPEGPVEWMEVLPGRSRGREREPLVIVRRGHDHSERAYLDGASGHWEELPGSSKGKWQPGGGGGSSGGMR
jgi:tetratricopeptide (TPR) repeat protein